MPLDLTAHVWVRDGVGTQPGLLCAWRQRAGRWEGWVIVIHKFVTGARGAADVQYEWSVHQSWVDAKSIKPR